LRPGEWRRYISFLVKRYAELQEFPAGALFIPPIVVIDTLVSAIPLDSENDNAELSGALIEMEKGTRVSRLAFDASLWILDHTPKSTWESGKAAYGRGAGAKVGEADQIIGIHRHRLEDTTTLLELLKPPREGSALPMMKVQFDSIDGNGLDILG